MRAPRGVAAVVLLAIVAFLWWRSANAPTPHDPARDASPAGRMAHAAGEAPAPVLAASGLAGAMPKPAPRPPLAAPQGSRVTGRVVDAAGKAVAGARVASTSDANARTFALGEAGTEGSPATATTSDAEGRFAIAVKDDAPFHYLTATADGHGVAVKPGIRPGAEVVLALPRATALVGTVTDREGKPVVGARVRLLMLFDAMRIERATRSGEGGAYRVAGVPPTGDAQAWRGFVARAWVEAVAEGYAPAFVDAPPLPSDSEETRLDLVLSRGITLLGKVVDDETGAPVEGATVDLQSKEGWQSFGRDGGVTLASPYGPRSVARRTTGADGAFRFDHVAGAIPEPTTRARSAASRGGSPVVVVAWKAGLAQQGARAALAEKEGAVQEVVVRLRRAGTVSGRVVDAEGTPVAGATVVAKVVGYEVGASSAPSLLPADAPRAWTVTGEDGRFLLTGVPARTSGPVAVTVETYRPMPAGSVPGRNARQAAHAEARVEVGRATDVGDLRLPSVELGPTVRVRVLDAEGRPVWGAKVIAGWTEAARTDRAGEASWSNVAKGDASVRAAGFAPAPFPVPESGSGTETIELRLERGRSVSGRVLRADRTPAARADVSVARGSVPLEEAFRVPFPGGRPNALATVETTADGVFAFVDLVPGPWRLLATLPKRVGLPDSGSDLRVVVSDVPSDATGVELVLPADDSPATGQLEGRVVSGAAGEEVEGLSIRLLRGEEIVGRGAQQDRDIGREFAPGVVLVKRDGSFAFDRVPVGTVSLEVSARGWLAQRIDGIEVRLDATTTMPPVVMRRGASARGALRAAGLASWAGRQVVFRRVGGDSTGSQTVAVAPDGTYRAAGLAPGTYEIVVPRGGHVPGGPLLPRGPATIVVPEGAGEVALDLDLTAAANLTIEPEDPRLPPPPWKESLRPTAEQTKFGGATRVRVTAADGTVVVDRTGAHQQGLFDAHGLVGQRSFIVPLGRYVARIDYPGGESLEETIVLDADANAFVVRFRGR